MLINNLVWKVVNGIVKGKKFKYKTFSEIKFKNKNNFFICLNLNDTLFLISNFFKKKL